MLKAIDHSDPRRVDTPGLTMLWTERHRRGLYASGAWDLAGAPRLSAALTEHAGQTRLLRLDLSDVTFLDCACLEVLLETHQRMLAAGGSLVLTGVTARIARLIELAGLSGVLYTTRLSDLDDHADPLDPVTGLLASAGG